MLDYEAEYNNRARVPEHPAHLAAYARDAAAYRQICPHEEAIPFGATARTVYDYFPAENSIATALFIHGGYWQALSRSEFSHMAAGPNARGISVAVMGYDLCPDVTLATIVEQTREAALSLWRRSGAPILAYGHSAGGHLAAMLLATDWKSRDANAPRDLVKAGLSISGLFDLAPLLQTYVNARLGLDEAEAHRLSPAEMMPVAGTRLDAIVGGRESSEYHRQSRLITEAWGPLGCRTDYGEIDGADHFTVIAGLAEPDSDLTRRLVALAD